MARLKNTFLVILRKKPSNHLWETIEEEILIDPLFKSHFIIGPDLPMYHKFVEALPHVVVAPAPIFKNVVEECATVMEKAFLEYEQWIPPWRTQPATLSNWFSEVCSFNVFL